MKIVIEFDENQCRMNTSKELDELETAFKDFLVSSVDEYDMQSPLGAALRTVESVEFVRFIIEEDEDG